ncbi:MAG: DUF86 domain-containing protein [Prochlorothrix sp.]
MSKADGLTRLRHILDSAKLALTFVAGATRETLNQDIKLVLAIVRLLEVIGEAANHVSVETQTQIPQIPQIPWRQLVGMRNRLIHAYFDVDLEVI